MFQLLKDKIQNIISGIRSLRGGGKIDLNAVINDLEMALINNDVNVDASTHIAQQIRREIENLNISGKENADTIVSEKILEVIQNLLTAKISRSIFLQNVTADKDVYVVLLLGLQGSGKTTTCVKLANRLQSHMSVAVTSLDPYRPAADEQLRTLCTQSNNIKYIPMTHKNPVKQAQEALNHARNEKIQVLILDTAGRINIDDEMLEELKNIDNAVQPQERVLVVDSLMGQNALTMAQDFDRTLKIQNLVLTRLDSDQRGGAVLSLRFAMDAPIILIGCGEKISDLDLFHPDRLARCIVGMGDVSSILEKIGKHKLEENKKILQQGHMNLEGMLQQFRQMKDAGGLQSIMENLPNITSQQIEMIQRKSQMQNFEQGEAVILSMTVQERQQPQIINGSRKKRIAQGSGTSILAVNRILKQWQQSNQIIKKMKNKNFMPNSDMSMRMPNNMPKF